MKKEWVRGSKVRKELTTARNERGRYETNYRSYVPVIQCLYLYSNQYGCM
jgi:hypothetical protein